MDQLIQKLKDAGISFQITFDLSKDVTVHAFDKNGELHITNGIVETIALEKMIDKLL